jgi:hypothetical protein
MRFDRSSKAALSDFGIVLAGEALSSTVQLPDPRMTEPVPVKF